MDMNVKRRDPSSICAGCLSVDRKLTPINDEQHKSFFSEILDPLETPSSLQLCWECAARVRMVVAFKQQIRLAHYTMVKFMIHQSDLKTLSKLNRHTPPPLIECEELTTNYIQREITKCSIELSQNLIGKHENCIENEYDFVKLEQKSDLDEVFNDGDSVEPGKGERIFKKEKINSKKSKKAKRKKVAEFNDSDDEPLGCKRGTADTGGGEGEGGKTGRLTCAEARLAALGVPRGAVTMVRLEWDEVEAERALVRSSPRWLSATRRCESCLLVFNHSDKLRAHNVKHEPRPGALLCSVCAVYCGGERALQAHIRRHRVRWRCEWCLGRWSRAGVAADHVSRAHLAPPPTHRCHVCSHTASSLAALRAHSKSHAARVACDHCERTFRDRASLRTHLLIHTGVKEWHCPHAGCGKQFLFKKAMELHAATHEGHQHLYCHQCDVTFKNRMSLYQHMKYNLKHVDPKLLKHCCDDCGARFLRAARLAEHRAAAHLRAAPHKCPQDGCDFRCASRGVLRAHRRAHSGVRPARNHVCHHCGKTYTSKKSLENHLRSHTGEKAPPRHPRGQTAAARREMGKNESEPLTAAAKQTTEKSS